jgi:hypothetical protein
MAEKAKDPKQVMDVSKPGKTAANATARPVIVGHRSIVQDPMVNAAEEANPDVPKEEPAPTVTPAGKKVITPISEPENPADEEAVQESEQPAESAEQAAEAPVDSTDGESSETAVVDAVADQVGAKKKEEQLSEEEKKKQEALDKLVAEKKYFVPIGKAHHKSRKTAPIVLLVLLLLVAGGLAAVDAGVLDIGVDLPFDIIKNN